MDPFWAAVLGGGVGGVIVAIVESVLGRFREHERWLRDQRHRTYAEFLDIAQRAYDAHRRVLATAVDSHEPDRAVGRELSNLEAVAQALAAAERRIQVIGTPAMRELALRVRLAHESFGRAVEDSFSGLTVKQGGNPMSELAEYQMQEYEVRDFANGARRELGAGRDLRYRLRRWRRWRRARNRNRPRKV